MIVEGVPPVGGDGVSGRFAHVVEKHGEPGDEVGRRRVESAQRVHVDVVHVIAALFNTDHRG
jgi:hypothetical protein